MTLIRNLTQVSSPIAGTEAFHVDVLGTGSRYMTPLQIQNDLGGGKVAVSASAPTVADDDTQGFQVGSRWIQTTTQPIYYTCTDATTGAAVWVRISSPKFNAAGGGAPTVNDDETLGYEPASIWVDEVGDAVYFCEDATTGAASWIQSGGGGGGGGGSTPLQTSFVSLSATVAATASTTEILPLDNVITASATIPFDAVDHRWTPTEAGYYLVTAARSHISSSFSESLLRVFVNGATNYSGGRSGSGSVSDVATCVVYCDGVSDYIDIRSYQSTGSGDYRGDTAGPGYWCYGMVTLLSGGGGGGSSSGGASYLSLAGNQTGVSTGDDVLITESEGSAVSPDAGGQFTVAGGATAVFIASLRATLNSSTEVLDYGWYDVTNSTHIGNRAVIRANDSTDPQSFQSLAIAVVSPSVTTTYSLRVANVTGTVDITAFSSGATVVLLGGAGGGGGPYERFKVTKSAAQSIPNATNTKVELDSVVFNGSNYDAVTNYEWTCPNDMYARISFSVGLENIGSPSPTERAAAYIFVNGSAVAITEDTISDSNQTLELNDIFDLTAGDTVDFRLWQESGAAIDISTDTRRTRASIEELP